MTASQPSGYRQLKPFVVAGLLLACPWTPEPTLAAGIVLATAVVIRVLNTRVRTAQVTEPESLRHEAGSV